METSRSPKTTRLRCRMADAERHADLARLSSKCIRLPAFPRSQTLGGTGTVVFGQSLCQCRLYMMGSAADADNRAGYHGCVARTGRSATTAALIEGLPTTCRGGEPGDNRGRRGGWHDHDRWNGRRERRHAQWPQWGDRKPLQATNLPDIGTNYAGRMAAFSLGGSLSNSGNTLGKLTGPGDVHIEWNDPGGHRERGGGYKFRRLRYARWRDP